MLTFCPFCHMVETIVTNMIYYFKLINSFNKEIACDE